LRAFGRGGKDGGNRDIPRKECKAIKRQFGATGMRTETFIAGAVTAGTALLLSYSPVSRNVRSQVLTGQVKVLWRVKNGGKGIAR
jgi:hypothetical protein